MKRLLALIIVCSFGSVSAQEYQKFTLITMLYNELNAERAQEYIACLERNMHHDRIEHIHVVYDTVKDTASTPIHDYLKQSGVTISYVQGRVTYGYCFDLVNRMYPNRRIILSNADIYFNETLLLLDSVDLTNRFLALTRWNVLQDGNLEIFKQYDKEGKFWPDASYNSQDVWIFQSPLRSFAYDAIVMGTMQCDSRIAYQAHNSGLQVLNPCLSIQCCHLHLSDLRNYDKSERYTEYHLMRGVEWCYLPPRSSRVPEGAR